MNFLLDISQGDYGSNLMQKYGFGETALFGLQVVLIGMATVFAVLTIIWAALALFKFILHDMKKTAVKKDDKPVVISEPIVSTSNTEEEVIAVIAAAIAMAESESTKGIKFRVVSFKKR